MAKKSSVPAFEKYLGSLKINKGTPHAEVFLLTCIDFRFFTLIARTMHRLGYTGKYDHFILAGASLGATLDFSDAHLPAPQPPDCKCKPLLPRLHWQQVFIEHLQIALQLHKSIHTVMIIEHRKCGAYEAFLKPGGYPDPIPKDDPEKAAHRKQARKLEGIIKQHFPHLDVSRWLARLTPDSVDPLRAMDEGGEEALELEALG